MSPSATIRETWLLFGFFYQERFLCEAVCSEFAGGEVSLKEVIQARREQRKRVRLGITERLSVLDKMNNDTRQAKPAFLETKEYRRFAEFCDACRTSQYIGLCHGYPGVGKTLSAWQYTKWQLIQPFFPDRFYVNYRLTH
jgi:hypothetical protein